MLFSINKQQLHYFVSGNDIQKNQPDVLSLSSALGVAKGGPDPPSLNQTLPLTA